MDAIPLQDRLVYVMVSVSAVDRDMGVDETRRIGDIARTLPVFDGWDPERVVQAAQACRDILQEDEGLATILRLAGEMPQNLRHTAYALAAEVAAADRNVTAEEVRFLSLLRSALGLRKLDCAALEHAAWARHQTAPHAIE